MLYKKISNTFLGFIAVVGIASFAVIALGPLKNSDIFLGAQVGKGDDPTVPDAPVLDEATSGNGEVSLSWTAPDDGGSPITDYTVKVYSDGKLNKTISTKSINTLYTVVDLVNGQEFGFSVVAKNAIGLSLDSNMEYATPTAKDVATVPSTPTDLMSSAGDSYLDLSWVAPEDDGGSEITGYILSVISNGKESFVELDSAVTTHTLSDLVNGREYVVKVAATNDVGTGDYSESITDTPSMNMTVPEVPTGITLTPGDSTISVSWIAPSDGGSEILFYVISYTTAGKEQLVEVGGKSLSHTLSGLVNGTEYSVRILARNEIGDGAYSAANLATPDKNISPSIVGTPSVVSSDTSAVITWSTNKNTSTKVDFGLLTVKTSTPEYNKETRVTNHSVTIHDLLACTTYVYVVKSYDALSQVATGGEEKFTTTGCLTSAEIQKVKEDVVDTTIGGVVDFTETDVKTKLSVPQNLKLGEEEILFQVKLLEKGTTKQEIGLPTQKSVWLGDHVYDLSAYNPQTEEKVNNFDTPLTVSIQYSRDDVRGISLNTLKIFHYNEEFGWRSLQECSNIYDPTTAQGEISCETGSFSIFGLFGEDSISSSGSVSAGTRVNEKSLVVLTEEIKEEIQKQDAKEKEEEINKHILPKSFNRDLWFGVANTDVMDLQKFLNQQGFVVAESGPGSPGKETGYFGLKTFRALKQFQAFYRNSISAPSTFQKASGYLDYFTRQFIQENF